MSTVHPFVSWPKRSGVKWGVKVGLNGVEGLGVAGGDNISLSSERSVCGAERSKEIEMISKWTPLPAGVWV
jgi:hypothetical protein